MKILVLSGAALMLCGCAYPASSISQGVESGHLRFSAPIGAAVRVDGKDRGLIVADHPLIVDVDPAKHIVDEMSGGQIILHREYEVGAGSTVEIREQN